MVKETLKKIGSRFAFEYFLEVWKPKLVDALRNWLKRYTVEDIQKMVSRGRLPDTSKLEFGGLSDYVEYVEKISIERLVEDFLAPARPDIIQAIQDMGMPGAKWLVKLRLHLLNRIRQGVKSESTTPKEDIAMATCDACGQSWPVARSEFDAIKECPFCHTESDKQSPPS